MRLKHRGVIVPKALEYGDCLDEVSFARMQDAEQQAAHRACRAHAPTAARATRALPHNVPERPGRARPRSDQRRARPTTPSPPAPRKRALRPEARPSPWPEFACRGWQPLGLAGASRASALVVATVSPTLLTGQVSCYPRPPALRIPCAFTIGGNRAAVHHTARLAPTVFGMNGRCSGSAVRRLTNDRRAP